MIRAPGRFRFGRWLAPLLVTLIACGVPGVPQVDLDGRVTDMFGVGVPGVSVAVEGHTPTTTATDGSFAFTGVSTPYDVLAYSVVDEWAHLFNGPSTPQPRIVPFEAMFGGSILDGSSATINVTHDMIIAANQALIVCAENPSVALSGCEELGSVDPNPSPLSVGWFGFGSVDASVRVFLFSIGTDDLPVSVLRTGIATVTVSDGDTVGLNVTTAVTTEVDVTVQVTEPAGTSLSGLGAIVVLPDGRNSMRMPFGIPAGTTASMTLPSIPGASVFVVGQGTSASTSTLLAWSAPVALATTTVDLTLPSPPTLVAPADGAVGIGAGDTFEVTDRAGEAYTFVFGPDGVPGPTVLVSTVDGSVVLPDLSGYGSALALPGATAYDWRVFVSATIGDADDLVTDGGVGAGYGTLMLAGSSGFGPGPEAAGSFVVGAERSFTTP